MRGSMECRRCRQVVQGQDVCDWVQSLLLLRGEWPPLDCLPTPPPPNTGRSADLGERKNRFICFFSFSICLMQKETN